MPPGVGYPPPMAAPPGAPMVPGPGPTAPAGVATDNQGARMSGMVMAGVAVKALERAVALVGATTEEGQAILKALTGLSKVIGQPNTDVTRQEVKLLDTSAPAMSGASGGGPPGAPLVDIKDRLARFGLGGAAA